ncbi:MAG: hypothetical protein ACXVAW_19130 [Vulcanimicrobiaceae bacterium]
MPEIEALLKRRESPGALDGRYEQDYPNIQYGPALADTFGDHVGVTVRPQYVLRPYSEFGRDDEDVIRGFTRIMQNTKFKYRPLEEGLIAGEAASAQFVDVAAAGFAFEARADGRFTVCGPFSLSAAHASTSMSTTESANDVARAISFPRLGLA